MAIIWSDKCSVVYVMVRCPTDLFLSRKSFPGVMIFFSNLVHFSFNLSFDQTSVLVSVGFRILRRALDQAVLGLIASLNKVENPAEFSVPCLS